MRSRSFEIFIAMAISRRSTATGWRVASMRIANWSISSSSASTASSRSTTCVGEVDIAGDQRLDAAADLVLDQAAHLEDLARQVGDLLIVGFDGVVSDHATVPFAQPNRPVM